MGPQVATAHPAVAGPSTSTPEHPSIVPASRSMRPAAVAAQGAVGTMGASASAGMVSQGPTPGPSTAANLPAQAPQPQLAVPAAALGNVAAAAGSAFYHNLIPAYYISAANLQPGGGPRGGAVGVGAHPRPGAPIALHQAGGHPGAGFLVQAGPGGQPTFIQQPMQYLQAASLQAPPVIYQPIEAATIGQPVQLAPQMRRNEGSESVSVSALIFYLDR